MRRRSFLVTLTGLLSMKKSCEADPGEQELSLYLTRGRTHRLLATDVADGLTLRSEAGNGGIVLEFKRYDLAPEVFRSLALGVQESSGGVYVRGKVSCSVRLFQGVDTVAKLQTGVGFARRARVSVFRERDPGWPPGTGQVVVVIAEDTLSHS